MNKIYAIARAIMVLVAIASAFADIPQLAAILVVLGIISGIGTESESSPRVLLAALVLSGYHGVLEAIPAAGGYLSTIFGSIGIAAVGASVSIVALGIYNRIMGDWK